MDTKTLKINADVYQTLKFCRDKNNSESMNDLIYRLLKEYLHCKSEIVRDDEDFYLVIDGRKKKFPVFSSSSKIVRIHKEIYSWLNKLKVHPDETYNTLLFKFISVHYRNKPIYRIFGGEGCGNCVFLEEYVTKELMEIQKIHDGLFVEKLLCHDHMELMKEYDVTMMPLSILYNVDGTVVWHAKGSHNNEKVKNAIESVLV